MKNWDKFYGFGDESFRRRVGVIFVGSGSRVTRKDLDAMRRVVFMGELFIVSDSVEILAFLAQRIHRKLGVHYHFAKDEEDIAVLIRDTLVEAYGGQEVYVKDDYKQTDTSLLSRHTFDVVDHDHSILV